MLFTHVCTYDIKISNHQLSSLPLEIFFDCLVSPQNICFSFCAGGSVWEFSAPLLKKTNFKHFISCLRNILKYFLLSRSIVLKMVLFRKMKQRTFFLEMQRILTDNSPKLQTIQKTQKQKITNTKIYLACLIASTSELNFIVLAVL